MTPAELITRQTALGMSNTQLAKALGYSPVTISYWRNGVRPIPPGLEERLAVLPQAQGLPPLSGRPVKATYALPQADGTYAFYFDQAGDPLSLENKMALSPGSLFWLGRSATSHYDGSDQQQYVRSAIPGHRQLSHPCDSVRKAPKRVV